MNVIAAPFKAAISLVVLVVRVVVGGIQDVAVGDVDLMLSPNSPLENSTGMAPPRRFWIWRMIHSSLVVWSMW